MEERWEWREAVGAASEGLEEALPGVDRDHAQLIARLLYNRGVFDGPAATAFLVPALSGLRSPMLVEGMAGMAQRLADAVCGGERMAVSGGDDLDGTLAMAVLLDGLRRMGADGAVPMWAEGGAHEVGLRVSTECERAPGSGASARIAVAGSIVLGFGGVGVSSGSSTAEERTEVVGREAVTGLSRSGVALYLLLGLRMILRQRGWTRLVNLRDYLDLVAIGTIAAGANLVGENRVLVSHGLQVIDGSRRPGLRALLQHALIERATVEAISAGIVPRLEPRSDADAAEVLELVTTETFERGSVLSAAREVRYAHRQLERVRGDFRASGGGAGANRAAVPIDAELPLVQVTSRLAAAVARLEPHGPGNPLVSLLVRSAEIVSARVVGDVDRPHLKMRLKKDGRTVTALGVGLGHLPLYAGFVVDVVCRPRITVWHGVERLQLEVRALRPARSGREMQAAGTACESTIP